jgi:3-oxoacyl-[acyl-carrier-protein] synthase II
VVLTGLGAVTPVGIGVKAFWGALQEGVSGIDTITRFDPSPFPCRVAAEVRGFEPRHFMSAKRAAITTRFVQLGVAAGRMAYDDAGLAATPLANRFPVCFASSASAVPEFQETIQEFVEAGSRRISPAVMLESVGHAATNHVAVELGLRGQTMTLASGCASALDAIQWGCDQIRDGRAPGVLIGATDAPLSTSVLAAWCAMGLLSRWAGPPAQALRPFDALMDGLVIGEGAGAFVLEDLDHALGRGARIYAEVLGYGMGTDGLHQGGVDPRGPSIQTAVRGALRAARLDPEDLDYVNSHGSGSPEHDRAETAAYRAVFGRYAYSIPVSSIKPMTGQSFAAAGALQIIAACFALEEQFVPPTLNHDIPDHACDLDYVPLRGRGARLNRVLVTVRTLGPTYSAVILGRYSDSDPTRS